MSSMRGTTLRTVGTLKPLRKLSSSGLVLGVKASQATRVMVNRTDIGTRNGRLSVSRGEGPRGRVNPTCDAHWVASQTPMDYVTATQRDAMACDTVDGTDRMIAQARRALP